MSIEIFDGGACKAVGRLYLPIDPPPAPPGTDPPAVLGQGIKSLEATAPNTVLLELVEAIAQTEFVGFAQFTQPIPVPLIDLEGVAINVRWVDPTHIEISAANFSGAKGITATTELFFVFFRFALAPLAGVNNIP